MNKKEALQKELRERILQKVSFDFMKALAGVSATMGEIRETLLTLQESFDVMVDDADDSSILQLENSYD